MRLMAIPLLPAFVLLLACQGPSGKVKADEAKTEAEKRDEAAQPIEVMPVFAATVSSYLTSSTNLEARSEARVLSESEGIVRQLLVEEGDGVKKGQPLARLDDREAGVTLRRAKARADSDAAAWRRGQDLRKRGMMSDEEFEKLDLAKRLSEAELEHALLALAQKEIAAPFDGKVTQRLCRVGERVVPTQLLFTVADFDPLVAIVHLPERHVARLRPGVEVAAMAATTDGEDGPAVKAYVAQVSPVVDPKTGTVKVTLAVPKAPDGMRPGSFIRVKLVQDTHEQALLIPREAVVRDLAESFIYVLKPSQAGDRVDKRRVELGMTERGYVEILSGVSKGEKVVTVGQGGLRAKSLVKVIRERPIPQA